MHVTPEMRAHGAAVGNLICACIALEIESKTLETRRAENVPSMQVVRDSKNGGRVQSSTDLNRDRL